LNLETPKYAHTGFTSPFDPQSAIISGLFVLCSSRKQVSAADSRMLDNSFRRTAYSYKTTHKYSLGQLDNHYAYQLAKLVTINIYHLPSIRVLARDQSKIPSDIHLGQVSHFYSDGIIPTNTNSCNI